jgi:hypothetical protein
MLTVILSVLGVAIWMVSDIGFQTYGYVIGDTDAE